MGIKYADKRVIKNRFIIGLCLLWMYSRLETRAWYIRACAFASANHIVKYALMLCVLVIAQGIIYYRELPSGKDID